MMATSNGESLETAFDSIKRDVGLMLTTASISSDDEGGSSKRAVPRSILKKREHTRIGVDGADTSDVLNRIKDLLVSAAPESGSDEDSYSFSRKDAPSLRGQREWQAIERELQHIQGLASWAVQRTPSGFQSKLQSNIREEIEDASHYLIEGTASKKTSETRAQEKSHSSWFGKEDDGKSRKSQLISTTSSSWYDRKMHAWVSPQAARSAIIQEAISLAVKTENSISTSYSVSNPLVIVVVEREASLGKSNGNHALEHESIEESEGESFLSAWTRASHGLAKVVTVVGATSSQLGVALEETLTKASRESSLPPVLVNLYASCDSIITSKLSSLRQLCDLHNTLLCVEGPGLALIAQPDCPSDPEECAKYAHVLMLDPGSWFGFKMCAALTRHNMKDISGKNKQVANKSNRYSTSDGLFASVDEDDGLSIVPLLNLWTVLSRVGLQRMRSMVDEATALSEKLVVSFAESTNIKTIYDGIGCVVRISSAMSREDRLRKKYKARSLVANANKAIYSHLEDNARAVMVYLHTVGNCTYLQFSPARLLRSGSLWIPSDSAMNDFIASLQTAVDIYETCVISSATFASKMSKCQDIDTMGDETNVEGRKLCFGSFFVVPYELGDDWKSKQSSVDIVRQLTVSVASDVHASIGNTETERFSHSGHVKNVTNISNGNSAMRRGRSGRTRSSSSTSPRVEKRTEKQQVPFLVRLNNGKRNVFPNYITIEPKAPMTATRAVDASEKAAEVVLFSVNRIVGGWRTGNQLLPVPMHLENISGKEGTGSSSRYNGKMSFLQNMRSMASSGRGWEKESSGAEKEKEDDNSSGKLSKSSKIDVQEQDEDVFYSAGSGEDRSISTGLSPTSITKKNRTKRSGRSDIPKDISNNQKVGKDAKKQSSQGTSGRSNASVRPASRRSEHKSTSKSRSRETSSTSRRQSEKAKSSGKDSGWFGKWSSQRDESEDSEDFISRRKQGNDGSEDSDRECDGELSTSSESDENTSGSSSSSYSEYSSGEKVEGEYDSEDGGMKSEIGSDSGGEGSEGRGSSDSNSIYSRESLASRSRKSKSNSKQVESQNRPGWLSRWMSGNGDASVKYAASEESGVGSSYEASERTFRRGASNKSKKSPKGPGITNRAYKKRLEESEYSEDTSVETDMSDSSEDDYARPAERSRIGSGASRKDVIEPTSGAFGFNWFSSGNSTVQTKPKSNGMSSEMRRGSYSYSNTGRGTPSVTGDSSSSEDDVTKRNSLYSSSDSEESCGSKSESGSSRDGSRSESREYDSEDGSDSSTGSGDSESESTESSEDRDTDLIRKGRGKQAEGLFSGYGQWMTGRQSGEEIYRSRAEEEEYVGGTASVREKTYGSRRGSFSRDRGGKDDRERSSWKGQDERSGKSRVSSQWAWWGPGEKVIERKGRRSSRSTYR